MNRAHAISLLVLVFSLVGGCASSAYHRLAAEQDDPVLASLALATTERPSTTFLYPTGPADSIVRVAVHETGNLDSPDVIVLVHGCVADHRTWRFLVGDLGRDHRLLLIDLPGSGESERPSMEAIGSPGYSPSALASRCADAIGAYLEQTEGVERITLVGHSLGATTILRLTSLSDLLTRHSALVSRVQCMVLISPVDAAVINPPAAFVAITELDDLTAAVADATGLLRERLSEGALRAAIDPAHALQRDVEMQMGILSDPQRRRTCQAQLLQAVPLEDGRPDWPRIDEIERAYDNVTVPCLILWGARDETLPCAMGFKLAAQIPTATLELLPDAKHSPHRDCPSVCAAMIRRFMLDLSRRTDSGTASGHRITGSAHPALEGSG